MQLAAGAEVFVLPVDEGGYLVYAPLAGQIVHANADCVAQFKRYLETGDAGCVSEEIISRIGGIEWLTKSLPAPTPGDLPYRPTVLTLFLTNRCNLRCTYCYAEGGEKPPCDMPAEIYRAAIDLVADNAAETGRGAFDVGFHGGGEPTLAWEALMGAVEHARATAEARQLKVRFTVATNGVMSPEQADLVARTFSGITLSHDGPPEIQDRQRPHGNGGGSSEAVAAFLRVLEAHGTHVAVRSTVTRYNVDRLCEMVDFFVDHTQCRFLHFEPLFLSGRACGRPDTAPEPLAFAEAFIRAVDHARERTVRVRYSAARLMGTYASFCGCAQDPFNVTPEGDVTACFEVCDRENAMTDTFFFGRFDPRTGRFVVDAPRLARLRKLNVYNKPICQRCFAKWNCSGDCPVKARQGPLDFESGSTRCVMNQTITKALLLRALDKETCMFV